MTTFVEFLAGNALALAVLAVVGALALAVFSLGGDTASAPTPTRPVAAATDLAPTADPVAVVGTPTVDAPLRAPVAGGDAVAFEAAVGSPLGHVAVVRAAVPFALDVDGVTVRVDPGDAPVVTDDRWEYTRIVGADDLEDADADALAALDADRSRLAKLLSGGIRPGRLDREYDVRAVRPGTPVAVVGHLARDDAGGWRLEAPGNASVRVLDPATVHRDHAVGD